MQLIPQHLPHLHLLHAQSRRPVRQRRKEKESRNNHGRNHNTSDPRSNVAFPRNHPLLSVPIRLLPQLLLSTEHKLHQRARDQRTGQMRREVMMQEELSPHKVERRVVSNPGEEEEAG